MNCKLCQINLNNSTRFPIITLPCNHTFCSTCFKGIKNNQCPECSRSIKETKKDYKKVDIIPYYSNTFNKTFQEYVYTLEELKLKFNSILESKYKEKDELINDLKSQITKHTNEIVHLIIGYQDQFFNQIDELKSKIETELDKTLDYQNEIQNHLEDLKCSLINERNNENYLANQIIQLYDDSIDNIDQLESIGFNFKFEQSSKFNLKISDFGELIKVENIETDCDKLVSVSSDGIIKIWNYKTGDCLKSYTGHHLSIICLKKLNNKEFFTGSKDCSIKQWNIKKNNCIKTFYGHRKSINCLELSSDKKYLISGSRDNSIIIWDIQSGDCLDILTGHTGTIYTLELLDKNRLVSTSSDFTIKIWNLKSNLCIQTLNDFKCAAYCILVLSNAEIISGDCDSNIKLWDVYSGLCLKTFRGHQSAIDTLKLLSETRLISSSHDRTLKIWDLKIGVCLKTIKFGAIARRFFVFNNQVVCPNRFDLKIYDIQSEKMIQTLFKHNYCINDAKIL